MNNSPNAGIPQKKNKRKFNFIDFLLILVIITVIGCVIYVFFPISWFQNLRKENVGAIQYSIEVKGVDSEFLNRIKENDVVIDSVSKSTLGTVTAVDYNTKYSVLKYEKNEKGDYVGVLSEYPDRYNIMITITADAEYTPGNGYMVNSCRIAIGEKMYLRFPDYVCEGYCIHLNTDIAR